MKKGNLLLLLVPFLIFTSCSKEVSTPSLVGKWNWIETTSYNQTLTSYNPIVKGSSVILEFSSNSTYTILENGNIIDKGTYTTGHKKNTSSNVEYDYYKFSNSSLPVPYLIYNYKVNDFNSVNEFPVIIDKSNGIMEVDFSLLGISGYGKIRYKKS
jgi:hypothetical protein